MAEPAEDVLATLESQYNEARMGGDPDPDPIDDLKKNLSQPDPEPDPEPDPDPDPDPEPDADPPSFMTYEEWIKAGKDPDDFRGKNAYNKTFEDIQENKDLRKQVRETRDMVQAVTNTIGEQREKAYNDAYTDLKAKLEQQKSDLDVDGVLETKDKLDNLKKAEGDNQTRQINPVIEEFLTRSPLTNSGSDAYDPEFFDSMRRYHANGVNELSQGGGGDLSDVQVLAIAQEAFRKAKQLYPEKFESKKNNRPNAKPSRSRPGKNAPTNVDYAAEMKKIALKTRNNISGQNTYAAFETYQLLLSKDKEKAERYAQNIIKIAEADNG
jgi:hypothetical protein